MGCRRTSFLTGVNVHHHSWCTAFWAIARCKMSFPHRVCLISRLSLMGQTQRSLLWQCSFSAWRRTHVIMCARLADHRTRPALQVPRRGVSLGCRPANGERPPPGLSHRGCPSWGRRTVTAMAVLLSAWRRTHVIMCARLADHRTRPALQVPRHGVSLGCRPANGECPHRGLSHRGCPSWGRRTGHC